MGGFVYYDGKPLKYDGWMIFSYFIEHTDEIYENLMDLEKILLGN